MRRFTPAYQATPKSDSSLDAEAIPRLVYLQLAYERRLIGGPEDKGSSYVEFGRVQRQVLIVRSGE